MNAARAGLERLAINQATVPRWTAEEAIEGCAREGYAAVGLWRDRVGESSPAHLAGVARAAGVHISSLCRGGWFCATDDAGRRARMEDNFRAVEEAAALGAATLVLVCGPAPSKDLKDGRLQVAEAIAELAEYAVTADVPLAIEPMHPVYCGDRSVVVTLAQALGLAASTPAGGVGVMIDSYHLWWEPEIEAGLAAAGDRVLGVQLADWIAPPGSAQRPGDARRRDDRPAGLLCRGGCHRLPGPDRGRDIQSGRLGSRTNPDLATGRRTVPRSMWRYDE